MRSCLFLGRSAVCVERGSCGVYSLDKLCGVHPPSALNKYISALYIRSYVSIYVFLSFLAS